MKYRFTFRRGLDEGEWFAKVHPKRHYILQGTPVSRVLMLGVLHDLHRVGDNTISCPAAFEAHLEVGDIVPVGKEEAHD